MVKKKSSNKRTSHAGTMKSFRVYKDSVPFTTFRITKQTVYWSILLLIIVISQLWILKLQLDIAHLTEALLTQQQQQQDQ